MKIKDTLFVLIIIAIFLPFIVSDAAYDYFISATKAHPYIAAYIKFAVLATVGEVLTLRISKGVYPYSTFGLIPKMLVWGVFGVWIALAMKTFASGSPQMLESFGISGVGEAMQGDFSGKRLLGAFITSAMLNTIFAPVFMTLHKITDMHIASNNGSMKSFIKPIAMRKYFTTLDWDTQWNFVFKKTIFLFWIPAHTITFLLPPTMQVLFAALLSIALGIFLSISRKRK